MMLRHDERICSNLLLCLQPQDVPSLPLHLLHLLSCDSSEFVHVLLAVVALCACLGGHGYERPQRSRGPGRPPVLHPTDSVSLHRGHHLVACSGGAGRSHAMSVLHETQAHTVGNDNKAATPHSTDHLVVQSAANAILGILQPLPLAFCFRPLATRPQECCSRV